MRSPCRREDSGWSRKLIETEFTQPKVYSASVTNGPDRPPARNAAQGRMSEIDLQRLNGEARRGARFLLVGFGGLAVDSGVFMILNNHTFDRPVARAVSLIVATLFTWRANRLFTFAASGRAQHNELARYGLVALGAQGFNYLLFLGLGVMAPKVHPLVLIVACAATAALFSYAGQRFFTFTAALTNPSSGQVKSADA